MELKTKTVMRKFALKLNLSSPLLEKWTREVIENIEKDELLVFDSKDKNALNEEFDQEGNILFLSHAKTPVCISEWLCIGCQCIRLNYYGRNIDKDTLASYITNAAKVLWPPNAVAQPAGPATFFGEIIVADRLAGFSKNNKADEKKFKCIIAHELVHVFDHLRFLVPAFMNWHNFWRYALNGGCACEMLLEHYQHVGLFVDSYGEENELRMIEEYWPSQAKAWFEALRQDTETT